MKKISPSASLAFVDGAPSTTPINVPLAIGIGNTIRAVGEALRSSRPDVQLARHQVRAIIERLGEIDRALAERESAGLDAGDLVPLVARAYRAAHDHGDSPTRRAAYFARYLDACAHLSVGDDPAEAHDSEWTEAIRLAVRVHGIGDTALTLFALAYPEDARKIDQASLDRLVTAWTAQVTGGRWPALARVWKERLRVNIAPLSIKHEMAKLPRDSA